jgi:alanine racemase
MDNSSFVSDKEELLIFDNASIASEAMNTISYELLVRLNERLERRVCN